MERVERSKLLQRRIDAALGRTDCDLVLRNATYLDVFSCSWRTGDIAIIDGTIVALEPGLKGAREVNLSGRKVVPGFIDAHVHIESSLMIPRHFERTVLSRGTTTAICDPHELANVQGTSGIRYFLNAAESMSMTLKVMLSSCVPATDMETNGGGKISADALVPLASHPCALGLAEMMNFPGVLAGDPDVLDKIAAFSGRPIDGHSPLLSGQALSAYVSAGISSCHECSRAEEAGEKLTKGVSVWIREGSVAKDLHALVPLLTMATSTCMGFCTDDRNPLDIAVEGHVDHLVRESIRLGVAPEIAYRAATWSPARHYGLNTGFRRIGALAPGYLADLVVLNDADSCAIHSVLKAGIWTSEILPVPEASQMSSSEAISANSVRARVPESQELVGPAGQVHVIGVEHGKLITERLVMAHDAPGVSRISVLERHGHGRKPANAYAFGFGELRGAIASSVGHDSHNLVVVGNNPAEMRVALSALIEVGGGFCVVKDGQVAARLALPLGGLMSERSPDEISTAVLQLKQAAKVIGCVLPEPFLQLAFVSLPVIPKLKLTDHGLVDVDAFRLIDVRAS